MLVHTCVEAVELFPPLSASSQKMVTWPRDLQMAHFRGNVFALHSKCSVIWLALVQKRHKPISQHQEGLDSREEYFEHAAF